MTDHEGLPVAGYQPQSTANVDQVNLNKLNEERLLRLIDLLVEGGTADIRWLSVARTHFEQGYMALNRAIFQPSRIELPEDLAVDDDEIPF